MNLEIPRRSPEQAEAEARYLQELVEAKKASDYDAAEKIMEQEIDDAHIEALTEEENRTIEKRRRLEMETTELQELRREIVPLRAEYEQARMELLRGEENRKLLRAYGRTQRMEIGRGVDDMYDQRLEGFLGDEQREEVVSDSLRALRGERSDMRNALEERRNNREKWAYETRNKIYSEVTEAFLVDQIKRWFGEYGCETQKGSSFDNRVNKVDVAGRLSPFSIKYHNGVKEVNVNEEDSKIGFALDATSGSGSLVKKFGQIKGNIINQKLGEVRYFSEYEEGGTGNGLKQLCNIPEFVINLNQEDVDRLLTYWDPSNRDGEAVLLKHPVQREVLDQMLLQLRSYWLYVKNMGTVPINLKKEEILDIYERANVVLKGLKREKTDVLKIEGWDELMERSRENLRNALVAKGFSLEKVDIPDPKDRTAEVKTTIPDVSQGSTKERLTLKNRAPKK